MAFAMSFFMCVVHGTKSPIDKLDQNVFEPIQWLDGMPGVFNKAQQVFTLEAISGRALTPYEEKLTARSPEFKI